MSTSHTNSQVSVELIISLVAFFLFSGFLFMIYINKNIEVNDRKISIIVQSIVDNVVFVSNTAILEGDGFSISLELPYEISGADYTLFFAGNWLYLNMTENSVLSSAPILNMNVIGNPKKGVNTIFNRGGMIYFE